jgi:rhodanese-related sulfurtransferase
VQTTDAFAATRNARIVLIDDNGVRATMTASWLIQMGWKDVFVVKDALESGPLLAGPASQEVLGLEQVKCDYITARQLKRELDAGNATAIDFDTSLRYRDSHIPGAWFAIRAHLEHNLKQIPGAKLLVLTSSDGIIAALAAPEAGQLTQTPVKVLHGGTNSWRAAGLPLESGMTHLADSTDDVQYRPYDRTDNIEAAMQDYLAWEMNLVKQIERDDDVNFRAFARR